MKKNLKFRAGICAGAAMLMLQACGTTHVSNGITDDGKAGEVIFPDIARDAWNKEGVFPNREHLRLVRPGVTKPQLYALLDRPHFNEGHAGVREWDYIFHFRDGEKTTSCQYKVIFDKDYKAQSFHWQPASCSAMAAIQDADKTIVKGPVAPPLREALESDALFAFDKSGLADLSEDGQRRLRRLAADLRRLQLGRVDVVGHTDRLGTDSYNQQLSNARAQTIREYLIIQGIPAERISAQGVGSTMPVVQCDRAALAELIGCLAVNRRVTVTGTGVRGANAE
jgi:OOP family OmpA-OmpF porin